MSQVFCPSCHFVARAHARSDFRLCHVNLANSFSTNVVRWIRHEHLDMQLSNLGLVEPHCSSVFLINDVPLVCRDE